MEPIITEWANRQSYGPSPVDVVHKLCDMLETDIKKFGLEFELDSEMFRKKMITALCVLYKLSLEGKPLHLSLQTNHFYPGNWNTGAEEAWIDYLESHFFTVDFWDALWDDVGITEWESDVFNWREELQAIIPMFIRRDMHKMLEDELKSEDEDSENDSYIYDSS